MGEVAISLLAPTSQEIVIQKKYESPSSVISSSALLYFSFSRSILFLLIGLSYPIFFYFDSIEVLHDQLSKAVGRYLASLFFRFFGLEGSIIFFFLSGALSALTGENLHMKMQSGPVASPVEEASNTTTTEPNIPPSEVSGANSDLQDSTRVHPSSGSDSSASNIKTEPSAESSSAPSALDERTEELINTNLEKRKGALADGQEVSEVRQAVEKDFFVKNKADEFYLIKKMEKEAESSSDDCPVTNSAFNEVKEYKSKIQDGRGGGRPYDCSSQEKNKAADE